MKKISKIFFVLILITSFFVVDVRNENNTSISVDAQMVYSDASYFVLGSSGTSIVGLSEEGKAASEIVIPSTINGKSITSIERQAFENNAIMKSVVIPSSITYIGYRAFANCSALESVVFEEGDDTHPGLIFDLYVFQGAFAAGAQVYLPRQIADFGNGPFRDTPNLAQLHMPKTLSNNRSIAIPSSFVNNSGITHLEIPEYVNSLGSYFMFKSKLEYITFKADVNTITIVDKAFQPQYGETHPDPAIPIIFNSKEECEIFAGRSPSYIHAHLTYEVALHFRDAQGNVLSGYDAQMKLMNFPYTHEKNAQGMWQNTQTSLPALPQATTSTGWTYQQGGHNDVLVSDPVTSDSAYLNVPIERVYVSLGTYQHFQIDAPIGEEGVDYIEYRGMYFAVEPILWEVIQQEGNVYTMLSTNLVDSQVFYEEATSNPTWSESDLRVWANTSFYEDAFTAYEQSLFLLRNEDYVDILRMEDYNAYENKGYPLPLLENERETRKTYYWQRQSERIHFGSGELFDSWMNTTYTYGSTIYMLIVDATAQTAKLADATQYYGVRPQIQIDVTSQVRQGSGTYEDPYRFSAQPTIREEMPNIQIDYENETLVGFIEDGLYTINGVDVEVVAGSVEIDSSYFDTTLEIVKKGDQVLTLDSLPQSLYVSQRIVIHPTGDNHFGSIYEVEAGYMYRPLGSSEWILASGEIVEGLLPGIYEVQKPASSTSFKSEIVQVEVLTVDTVVEIHSKHLSGDGLIATQGEEVVIDLHARALNGQIPEGMFVIKLGGEIIAQVEAVDAKASYTFTNVAQMHLDLVVEFQPIHEEVYLASAASTTFIVTIKNTPPHSGDTTFVYGWFVLLICSSLIIVKKLTS